MKLKISIGKKLLATTAIMTIPVVLMGSFLIKEKEAAITSTRLEIQGVQALRPLQELLDASMLAATADDIARGIATYDSAIVSAPFQERLKEIQPLLHTPGVTVADIAKAVDNKMSEVADDSGITLDPDMDTYYVGDIIVNQYAGVQDDLSHLHKAFKAGGFDEPTFNEALHNLQRHATGLSADYAKAKAGNADGAVKNALESSISQISATLASINTAVASKNSAAFEADYASVNSQIDSINGKTIDLLDQMLEHRVTTLRSQMLSRLSVAGLVALAGLGLTLFIVNSIARGIRKAANAAGELGEGNYSTAIAGMNRGDEIGDLARGMNQLRDAVANYSGQLSAINKAQAVIEFSLDGTILAANENFLNALGYGFDEIKGKHHSMFAEPSYRASAEYAEFWASLNRGQYQAGEFKRLGKGGKEVWIQASYNPIFNPEGKAFKVVKYATDITPMVTMRNENERGMKEAVMVLNELAGGNLTTDMQLEYQGTFGDIKRALNATIAKLRETVLGIKSSAEIINSAASEIASGSSDLSMRTEQQASSLEETAASMEEITGTVRQNSQNAATANELSTKANQVAAAGGKVVQEAVSAMSSIEKSSQKISDIIGVIDEIAFQTNLLALNAAVEAARAGDAGKGFAVVASEVRSLAGRSASASKEIKALINESVAQVKDGAELVNQSGETLKGILTSVSQVAGIVSEIAAASSQQATGIDEINTAVSQMDEVTQQNAALVEENTAAAQSMLEQAQTLEQMTSFFKVDGTEQKKLQTVAPAVAAHVAPKVAKPIAKKANGKANGHLTAPHIIHATAAKPLADGWEEF